MKIRLYQTDSMSWQKHHTLVDLLKQLPKSLHERALRYRSKESAFDYVLGRLLLKKALEEYGLKGDLEKLEYDNNGKPYLNAYLDGFFFNISHSSGRVVCAVSLDGEMGIDIEFLKPIVLSNFTAFFSEREWKDIVEAEDSLRLFYRYWTRKESIIKALGLTLAALHQLEINAQLDCVVVDEQKWFLQNIDWGSDLGRGFMGAICSEKKLLNLEVVEVKLF